MLIRTPLALWASLTIALIGLAPARDVAHGDSLEGPVVTAARQALETRHRVLALIGVRETDEREIPLAFEQTLAVRG